MGVVQAHFPDPPPGVAPVTEAPDGDTGGEVGVGGPGHPNNFNNFKMMATVQ